VIDIQQRKGPFETDSLFGGHFVN